MDTEDQTGINPAALKGYDFNYFEEEQEDYKTNKSAFELYN